MTAAEPGWTAVADRPGDTAARATAGASRAQGSAELAADLRGHHAAVGPPLTCGCTRPSPCPSPRMPSPAAPVCAIAEVTRSAISSSLSGVGQVVGDHLGLGPLLGGQLGAAGLVERLAASRRFFASLANTATTSSSESSPGLLAGHLGVGDRGQHHPQRRGAELVAGLDRGGQVGAQTVLQLSHEAHCGSLGGCFRGRQASPARSAPAAGASAPPAVRRGATRCARSRCAGHPADAACPGSEPLKVLHLSDIHLTPAARKQEWVRGLAALEPDLVVNTGDNLAHQRSVPVVLDALGDLLDVPGVFVFGSNDYCRPSPKNPLRYLLPDDGERKTHTAAAAVARPARRLHRRGWLDLNNRSASSPCGAPGRLRRRRRPAPGLRRPRGRRGAGRPTADVRLGVSHAPYLRVLDQFVARRVRRGPRGAHARRPAASGLGRDRHQLRPRPGPRQGLHPHPADSRPGTRPRWLHVSAGLGTSPYAPVRFCCPPEATLLTSPRPA